MRPWKMRKKTIWRKRRIIPPLTVEQILAWADAHHQRTGKWPKNTDGDIHDTVGETWKAIDHALRDGWRTLPGGSSLARLLVERRGARILCGKSRIVPPLTIEQILIWADAHHQRSGAWPKKSDGKIHDAAGETWLAIDAALRMGRRQLAGGSSLPELLAERRGVHKKTHRSALTVEQILAWADAHHQRTGAWPSVLAGPIADAPEETWAGMDSSLRLGLRRLPGGSSLAQLLQEARGVRNGAALPPLQVEQILRWADAHYQRVGEWPRSNSGPIPDCSETWMAVSSALRNGQRGLPGGSSLARLLAEHRGVRNHMDLLPLTPLAILVWADVHYRRTGTWPKGSDGEIHGAAGETWYAVDAALQLGCRSLPGGSSLAQLLAKFRGVRNIHKLPPLTAEDILAWADAHHRRAGTWPTKTTGSVVDAPGETWGGVDTILVRGRRGLPGGSTLHRFLRAHGRMGQEDFQAASRQR